MKNNNQESCNWIFNQCSVSGNWRAAKREHYNDLFNDNESDNVIKSKDINTLITLINKTDGNIVQMNKIVKIAKQYQK